MRCFYHSDMDGKCSAAIVYWYHRRKAQDVECIPMQYDKDFPFERIKEEEEVIIVDFSLNKPEDFDRLLKLTKSVIWIDHHKTAIEKHKSFKSLAGIRDIKKAACELTWRFYYPDISIAVPRIVELLADYDIWSFAYGETTNQLQAGIRLYNTGPKSPHWLNWLNLAPIEKSIKESVISKKTTGKPELTPSEIEANKICKEGRIALKYRNSYYKGLIKGFSFLTEFEGFKAVACNAGSVSSQLFDTATGDYGIMIAFAFNGDKWKISLYTRRPEIDVSLLAEKYGGGGHKGAASFYCKELPFKKV